MKTANRVKIARKHLGLTQAEMAKQAGDISPAAVSMWESGDTHPSMNALYPLKKKYNLNPDWVLSGVGQMIDDQDNTLCAPISPHIKTDTNKKIEQSLENIKKMLRNKSDAEIDKVVRLVALHLE